MKERKIYSVTDINDQILRRLETGFPDVWVRGDLSDFMRHSSGHWYFTLKDERSCLRAVMFRFQNSYLRFAPEEGMEVLCRGRITGYAPRSTYQLQVDFMEPVGMGALYLRFEQLKKKLETEGLFDPARKRPIPSPLRRVAVITSISGAAIHDVLRVMGERDPGIEVLVIPARVQGEGAAESVIRALALANRKEIRAAVDRLPIEAVIVTRGGGSLEDLWAFNDEALARAIAASTLPVISAVGHEIDFTIADFVSDARAPTPTAAAEMVSAGRSERLFALGSQLHRLFGSMVARLRTEEQRVSHAARLLGDPTSLILQRMVRVDDLMDRARLGVRASLSAAGHGLDHLAVRLGARDPRTARRLYESSLEGLSGRLAAGVAEALAARVHRLEKLEASLLALSPRAVLERGYAILRDENERIITDAALAARGQDLEVILARGRLAVKVERREE